LLQHRQLVKHQKKVGQARALPLTQVCQPIGSRRRTMSLSRRGVRRRRSKLWSWDKRPRQASRRKSEFCALLRKKHEMRIEVESRSQAIARKN